MREIAFLDIEASGLGALSWPIEAGWCFLRGTPQTMLIKPSVEWRKEAWDPAAEQLHGIPFSLIDRTGRSPADVCRAMNEAFKNADVYSDAPDWDGFWLYRLYGAARMRQSFKLSDFAELFAHIPPRQFARSKLQAEQSAPHRHRAEDDVLHMRVLYTLALN